MADDTYGGNDVLYGDDGDDILYGQGGNDTLYGGKGDDILYGGAGNDILYGGAGDDTLIGGTGDDTFIWENGDAGSIAAPAKDTIKDFGKDSADANGNDVLDLHDLLQGEENNSDLTQYLNFSYDNDNGNTVLKVSSTGGLDSSGNGFDQLITLEGVDLVNGDSNQDVINNLISAGKLLVDS